MDPVIAELLLIVAVASTCGLLVGGLFWVTHSLVCGKSLRVVKQSLEDSKNGSSVSELVERGPRDSGTFEQVD